MPQKLRVLFLDDDALVNFTLSKLLQGVGFQVTSVKDPVAALQIFRDAPHQYDVLVVDKVMPGMGGLEFARLALACRPAVPVVLASGRIDEEDEGIARALGIAHCVRKPFDVKALAALIIKAYARA